MESINAESSCPGRFAGFLCVQDSFDLGEHCNKHAQQPDESQSENRNEVRDSGWLPTGEHAGINRVSQDGLGNVAQATVCHGSHVDPKNDV